MTIVIEGVTKHFGSFRALNEIHLTIPQGKLVALLGPSGSGKSTLLRVIAGLEHTDQGRIHIDGRDATTLDVRHRNIGFVFQHYALFKHMTIRQNIAFALQIRRVPKTVVRERVKELLGLIQLEGLGDRYPAQLSGGQRQRVALARALAAQPQVLLLDEPFGALDAKVREELRVWLRRLHDEVQMTSIFVTHDQEEAMAVADEIVVMNQGSIEQIGTPAEIYDHPKTPFVMSFVGPVNILSGSTARLFQSQGWESSSEQGSLFIRPHDIDLRPTAHPSTVAACVRRVTDLGWEVRVELELPNRQPLTAFLTRSQLRDLSLQPGEAVFVKPRAAKAFLPKLDCVI
ncbi:sulfate/molybdate ABC transporter ATP-binding protein [Lyngbya confervoides]|uniref:ABC-type quaternary amine transporter n=1 Tax=Lyngbya confervoides BDU141951 TaxID=1574623 RepID=A0ABD4T042_9CYAN|nr:sulfate/molybdate ABC transporter ATP-binding protein [Lyngbya confervoides]MCM1982082.1 sulfate/molybdate ABC transporter ATP-binding protein [Lyngbya confervoides BDU141951]